MEKILLMGTDSSTGNALRACRKRNLYTIITDYIPVEKNPLKAMADEAWMINVGDIDALEEKCREEGVTAVFAGNHEFCLDCTMALCKRLGLPFYASEYSWQVGRDKALFKSLCRECGIDVAKSYDMEREIDPEILKTVEYPIVIKPVDSSSMRGISIVHNEEEFYKAYEFAMSFSASKRVIVEEFLTGPEFQITGYARNGKIKLAVTHAVLTNDVAGQEVICVATPFNAYKDPSIGPEYIDRVLNLARKMEIHDGMFFFQGMRHKGKACLIESAARFDGGGLWNCLDKITGFDMIGDMIDYARGKEMDYDFDQLDLDLHGASFVEYGLWVAPGVVKEVNGEAECLKDPKVQFLISRFKPGMKVEASGNMTQMGWYINMTADSRADLIDKMKMLNTNLQIIDENGKNLCIYYTRYDDILNLS